MDDARRATRRVLQRLHQRARRTLRDPQRLRFEQRRSFLAPLDRARRASAPRRGLKIGQHPGQMNPRRRLRRDGAHRRLVEHRQRRQPRIVDLTVLRDRQRGHRHDQHGAVRIPFQRRPELVQYRLRTGHHEHHPDRTSFVRPLQNAAVECSKRSNDQRFPRLPEATWSFRSMQTDLSPTSFTSTLTFLWERVS